MQLYYRFRYLSIVLSPAYFIFSCTKIKKIAIDVQLLYKHINCQHIMVTSLFSFKAKVGIGLFLSYTSFEVYMHLRTKQIISQRKQEYEKFSNSLDTNSIDKDVDFSKFKSATVAGMFVNPFDEYRPQTAFEFLLVRIMEVFESLYGNLIELHRKVTEEGASDVEGVLQSYKPDLELIRQNSILFQECISRNNFKNLTSTYNGWLNVFPTKSLPPLGHQMIFTWLGQSCSLVQISGINFLTDPILSKHLIAESFGPKRLMESSMSFEDIKYATNNNINFTLVSHDHPDHLEMNVVRKIGNSTTWILPLGLKKKFARNGIYNVIEMDWWDSVPLNQYISNEANLTDNYEVVCVPAMHWSGRYIFDSNTTLWCSYIIKRNGEALLYHAGDTGYLKELFKIIGAKYSPINLSLLPIGQYCPSWHQKPRHISPQESLQICECVSSKFMMGIHWGTFKLSSEPILEPKHLLEQYAAIMGKSDSYRAPHLGLTYVYDLEKKSIEER